jgi:hypothetical protein
VQWVAARAPIVKSRFPGRLTFRTEGHPTMREFARSKHEQMQYPATRKPLKLKPNRFHLSRDKLTCRFERQLCSASQPPVHTAAFCTLGSNRSFATPAPGGQKPAPTSPLDPNSAPPPVTRCTRPSYPPPCTPPYARGVYGGCTGGGGVKPRPTEFGLGLHPGAQGREELGTGAANRSDETGDPRGAGCVLSLIVWCPH